MSHTPNKHSKKAYDLRFTGFKQKLTLLGRLKPREEFLYPVMRSVPFNDMETRMDMALIDFGEKVQAAQAKLDAIEAARKEAEGDQ